MCTQRNPESVYAPTETQLRTIPKHKHKTTPFTYAPSSREQKYKFHDGRSYLLFVSQHLSFAHHLWRMIWTPIGRCVCMSECGSVCHCLRDTLLFLFHFIPYYGRARIIFHVIQFNVVVFVSLLYILFHSLFVLRRSVFRFRKMPHQQSVSALCRFPRNGVTFAKDVREKKGVEICARNFKAFLSSEIEGYIAVLGEQWCRTNWKEKKNKLSKFIRKLLRTRIHEGVWIQCVGR